MQQYDVRLKSILHRAMPQLFRLLGLPPAAEYLLAELPLRQKILPDLLVRLVDGRILHIELQSRNDPRMIWRCLEYWQVISEQWPDAEIVQVVIYLGDGPMTMVSSIARGRTQYAFDIHSLKDIDANAFLDSDSAAERMLAVLCHTDDPRATIAAILQSWKHLPASELSENLIDLLVLSQLSKRDILVREEVTAMPIEIDISENAVFKLGEERGEVKGERRGEIRGEVKVLTKFLERRFGPLPPSIRTRIESADIESLDRWVDRLPDASTLDAVFVD